MYFEVVDTMFSHGLSEGQSPTFAESVVSLLDQPRVFFCEIRRFEINGDPPLVVHLEHPVPNSLHHILPKVVSGHVEKVMRRYIAIVTLPLIAVVGDPVGFQDLRFVAPAIASLPVVETSTAAATIITSTKITDIRSQI